MRRYLTNCMEGLRNSTKKKTDGRARDFPNKRNTKHLVATLRATIVIVVVVVIAL